MSQVLNNLRTAYQTLSARVIRALHTQLGDPGQLQLQRDQVLAFLNAAEQVSVCVHLLLFSTISIMSTCQHSHLFEQDELGTMRGSVATMVAALDQACHQSSDAPDGNLPLVISRASTGRRGRPRVHIDATVLREALSYRGPTRLAPIFHCSSRTLRRRALELGISTPGVPVFTQEASADGTVQRRFAPQPPRVSNLRDNELDTLLADLLQTFPKFGRRMIAGWLQARGHRVPRVRITASYARVHGAPGVFGDRIIHRKVYNVAGANSLWHHDGQHGESHS